MSVDAKIMTVVNAIKMSLQMSMGPGSSVNSHPNPFFLNVNGSMDLKHAAETILVNLEMHEQAFRKKIEAAVQAADAEALRAKAEAKNLAANDTSVPV